MYHSRKVVKDESYYKDKEADNISMLHSEKANSRECREEKRRERTLEMRR